MVQTSSITMENMVGIVVRATDVDEKCDVFLSICLFVTLWNYEVCDNGNAMKQTFQNIMVSLHAGRFIVAHLYSTFSVDPRIFPLGKIYAKNYHFRDFRGCISPHS